MDRKSIEASLRACANNRPFISTRKLREWLGIGNDSFKEWTRGLDRRVMGNRIEFFIPDVATKILEEKL